MQQLASCKTTNQPNDVWTFAINKFQWKLEKCSYSKRISRDDSTAQAPTSNASRGSPRKHLAVLTCWSWMSWVKVPQQRNNEVKVRN